MNQQISIPFAKKSPTSREAAERIAGSAGALRQRVYEALCASPDGLTDQEIEERTGLSGNTVRPRRGELQKAGFVVDSGDQRMTKSCRFATVWRALSPEDARRERLKGLAERCRSL